MCVTTKLIGSAGSGKTTALLRLMDACGEPPERIGFVSFTNAAVDEAASRAADRYGLDMKVLKREGYFATLHAMCKRLLNVSSGQLIADDLKYQQDALGLRVRQAHTKEVGVGRSAGLEDGDLALQAWEFAKTSLKPYRWAYRELQRRGTYPPDPEVVRSHIERYERTKRMDNRYDFSDLLAAYAGVRFTFDGPEDTEPRGSVPAVPVWFLDEMQDASPLLDAVCKRLVSSPHTKRVYIAGDPFQSLYSFAGGKSSLFTSWPADETQIMPKSYRCPKAILALGERVLRPCPDYFDRKTQPADHEGVFTWSNNLKAVVRDIDMSRSTMILARTNFLFTAATGELNSQNVPWSPLAAETGSVWNSPKRNKIICACLALQRGQPIDRSEWSIIIDALPVSPKMSGMTLFERGAKAKWAAVEWRTGPASYTNINSVTEWGGTPDLVRILKSGAWSSLVQHADRHLQAIEKFGFGAVSDPPITVGTVHAAKGREADHVIVLTDLPPVCEKSVRDEDLWSEERRIAYVAVTRPRRELTLIRSMSKLSMPLPPRDWVPE